MTPMSIIIILCKNNRIYNIIIIMPPRRRWKIFGQSSDEPADRNRTKTNGYIPPHLLCYCSPLLNNIIPLLTANASLLRRNSFGPKMLLKKCVFAVRSGQVKLYTKDDDLTTVIVYDSNTRYIRFRYVNSNIIL